MVNKYLSTVFKFSPVVLIVLLLAGCASFEPAPVNESGPPPENPNNDFSASPAESESNVRDLEEQPAPEKQDFESLGDRPHVNIERKKDSTLITIDSKILFDVRSAEIKPQAQSTLDEIAKLLADKEQYWILVAGHTDSLPTRTQEFPSNWDLSASRAVNVVKYLGHMDGLHPSRLIAGGFGSYHPVAPNETERGRKLNRRVEIYLLKGGFPGKEFRNS